MSHSLLPEQQLAASQKRSELQTQLITTMEDDNRKAKEAVVRLIFLFLVFFSFSHAKSLSFFCSGQSQRSYIEE
jgi:hypothetical protein